MNSCSASNLSNFTSDFYYAVYINSVSFDQTPTYLRWGILYNAAMKLNDSEHHNFLSSETVVLFSSAAWNLIQ